MPPGSRRPGWTYVDGDAGLGELDRLNQHLEEIRANALATDAPTEPRNASSRRSGPSPKRARATPSGSTSSLSPPEQLISPTTATAMEDHQPTPGSPSSSDSSSEDQQPPPAPATTNYQTFGANPLSFDDPTLYHIRDVTEDLDDDDRKEIYCVSRFPKSDLSDRIAGTIPDKDFSNAKPANQVTANTFATWVEPHVRPLGEDEAAFLKERVSFRSVVLNNTNVVKGDRQTPFLTPRRGPKHWSDIFAEEDGSISVDSPQNRDKFPLNRARGSLDQISDDTAQTEQISIGPVLARVFGAMRYEGRPAPGEEKKEANGVVNGDVTMGGTNEAETNGEFGSGGDSEKPLPPATAFAESSQPGWKMTNLKMDHMQMEERIKIELRYLGLFPTDENPDYEAHYDDDICSRLRKLHTEVKTDLLTDAARKTRVLDFAKERMALQEYRGILEDLDSQVSQAYLKRTRTLGKSKKSSAKHHRPGGAGGGSHLVGGGGISKPGIGDVAKTLMERRHRWIDNIGPIFQDTNSNVPTKGQNIFEPSAMQELEKQELENWDDEAE
jgi:transcriptional adapter 3